MGMFFTAALVAFWREGRPFTWEAIKERFRLRKIRRADWIWAAAILILILVSYFGLSFSGEWVKSVPFLAPREVWPPEFGPGGTENLSPGDFMELPLKGQWWVIGMYFLGWFFNIFGEEFWFRGYILPRQELAFGKAAWLVNGLMFTLNHVWQPWIFIAILPSSLLTAFIVQVRKNTWISIVQHGVANISLLFYLIGGVLGMT
jgi:membrane protease YdiL (CAAX protease family)